MGIHFCSPVDSRCGTRILGGDCRLGLLVLSLDLNPEDCLLLVRTGLCGSRHDFGLLCVALCRMVPALQRHALAASGKDAKICPLPRARLADRRLRHLEKSGILKTLLPRKP